MIATNSIKWLLDDCCLYQQSSSGKLELNICELAGNLAYHAMMLEAHLTPKAGLVDCVSSGAHTDMDIHTFIASSDSLRPYMKKFVRAGYDMHELPAKSLLPGLRKVGIEAERMMFVATNNINTHKGMIFTLGLICGAVGWLYRKGLSFDAIHIRSVIMECCASLVSDDLRNSTKIPATAGERLYREHGMTGIRGEAAHGYPMIYIHGLPAYEEAIRKGHSEEQAMSQALLTIMAKNSDSNLVSRGGLEGLNYVQSLASDILSEGDSTRTGFEQAIWDLDQKLIEKNLSPGGSADLLAATWLLAQLNICSKM
ncbi:triphosphoribosyl-dephospho-CoA synthase CitG [Vibrio albus]|uniref:Probable 2-(5''-triphosphoribosyl)-3'-dephosphocoenzyme-A synthase n=1 Tax=Vibrio albus TaxID=2200953 RepID=A0A2U3B699_9VIBR|nr:triphosphoribosyl-dephospho-CoA synthase CitG [Vibrio albus]PWI32321.1 triphosphoribosyl-dephospho-CoA synthase CitG [Vibrio albus]